MSELILQAQRAKRLIGDDSLPQAERLSQACLALPAFEGARLLENAEELREEGREETREAKRGSHAEPAAESSPATCDAQTLVERIDAAASQTIAKELDRIVHDMTTGGEPARRAVEEARAHRDLMIPRLIRVLDDLMQSVRDGNWPENDIRFFALFLLSEFDAAEAFPTILQVMTMQCDLPYHLFGDVATEVVPRIFAQFGADNLETLDAVIRNREVDSSMRWVAAGAYTILVGTGRLAREEGLARLQGHLRAAIEREDVDSVSQLVCELRYLDPQEAMDDIREAFERDLVDQSCTRRENVENGTAEDAEEALESLVANYGLGVPDAAEELESWGCFDETANDSELAFSPEYVSMWLEAKRLGMGELPTEPEIETPRLLDDEHGGDPALSGRRAEPVLPRQKIGRNEPCPCGSGKKYKKCCGCGK